MTILFDANPLVNGNKSGVGYYTYGLVKALAETYPDDVRLVGHYFNFLGRKHDLDLPQAANVKYVQSRVVPGKVLAICRRLGFQLPLEFFFKRRGDIALFPNFVSLPSLSGVPTVPVIHDLCYLDFPEYVSAANRDFLRRFVPRSVRAARHVIAVSEATKAATKQHYAVADDRFIVTTTPPPTPSEATADLKKLGITKPFILFLGTLEPRKNVIGLVRAYAELPEATKREYQLVLAGGMGWYMEETMDYISERKRAGDNILLTGYVTDEQRAALYKQASVFALPSHYEGFGMPILEAMSYGTPTAISDLPVFHEVASEASVYFDKDDPANIAATLDAVLHDKALRQRLTKAGHQQVAAHTWQEVAERVFTALRPEA